MRRIARTDANHSLILGAFMRCGCEVESLHQLGGGVPDALIFNRSSGRLFLVEIKDGSKPPSARALTPDQREWHKRWEGAPVYIVETVEQAVALVAGKERT